MAAREQAAAALLAVAAPVPAARAAAAVPRAEVVAREQAALRAEVAGVLRAEVLAALLPEGAVRCGAARIPLVSVHSEPRTDFLRRPAIRAFIDIQWATLRLTKSCPLILTRQATHCRR